MRERGRRRIVIPFLLPACLVYGVFFLYPAFQAFSTSLYDWRGFTSNATYVGLSNYAAIPNDPVYAVSLWNNIAILVVGGVGVFAFAFGILILMRPGTRLWTRFRTIVFIPSVVPLVALGVFWGFIYNPRFGLLNAVLRAIGLVDLGSTPWMGPDLIKISVIVALVWAYAGFYTILLMTGADRIPRELLENADLEGASRLQVFRHITLPMTWNVLIIAVVLWIVDAMNQFDFIFTIGGSYQEPPSAIWTLPIYVFEEAFGQRMPVFRLGYGTAMAVTLVLIIAVGIAGARLLLRRERLEY
jgi:ABC-type sugar transport system permease subunit